MPYLRQMEANRWYSNFGPLAARLAQRMAAFFGKSPENIVLLSNGTAALTNILLALELPKGSYCLLPSWTFVATPAAILAAGLVPYFMDIDPDSWAVDIAKVRAKLRALGNVGAVIAVAPFGAPLDSEAWDGLQEETGIPVIIDAAAGFDSFSAMAVSRPRKAPVMISLHATKILGTGEGSMVLSDDASLIKRVRVMSNFGLNERRVISVPGNNAKMSEYHAAVGLAALDEWPQKRASWHTIKEHYLQALKSAPFAFHLQPFFEDAWVSSTLNIRLEGVAADDIIDALNECGIESRKWWGDGCHLQPAYAAYPRAALNATRVLGSQVIALPFTLDMSRKDVAYVVATLAEIMLIQSDCRQVYA